jgi:putative spermidine/putrescine transport system ATP-binding protein
MNNGLIEQFGTPAELYFQPVSVFSGDFLGESNLLQGQIREVSAGAVQVEIGPANRIRAQAASGAEEGAKVTCLVRPEAIQVIDGAGFDNEVDAVVQDVVVAGGVTRIYARMGDGTRILSVRLTSRHSQISRGTPIRFGWSAGDTIALR